MRAIVVVAVAFAGCGVVVDSGSKAEVVNCPSRPFATSEGTVEFADTTQQVAGVRCCNDVGGGAEFFGPPCTYTTRATADAKCQSANMRLCTEQELVALRCQECTPNEPSFVWASDDCTWAPTPAPAPAGRDCGLTQSYDDPVFDVDEVTGAVIDAEDLNLRFDLWAVNNTIPGAYGTGYIEWQGTNFFDVCDCRKINIRLNVQRAGRKRIRFRGYLTDPMSDHNDVYIRAPGLDLFGQRGSGKCWPRDNSRCFDEITNADVDCLPYCEGDNGLGYLKVYGVNSRPDEWTYGTKTSDGDARNVYVTIPAPGVYRLQLSVRSNLFPIDRILIFDEPETYNTNQVLAAQNNAQSATNAPTVCAQPP